MAEHCGNLVYQCNLCMDQINQLVCAVLPESGALFNFSAGQQQTLPNVNGPSELGFLYSVSWFYVVYTEIAKTDIVFLTELIKASGGEKASFVEKVLNNVHDLRTYFHHKLDPTKKSDKIKESNCKEWFKLNCGTALPAIEDQWKQCLIRLLKDNLTFLTELLQRIRIIEADENKQQILEQWIHRRERYHAPHEFDNIISEAAHDIGRDGVDVVKLRNRYYERWMGQLNQLRSGYCFCSEARGLVELVLLSELDAIMPVNGQDIMKVFSLVSGPIVGELLIIARKIYMEEPCGKDDLINKLRTNEFVKNLFISA